MSKIKLNRTLFERDDDEHSELEIPSGDDELDEVFARYQLYKDSYCMDPFYIFSRWDYFTNEDNLETALLEQFKPGGKIYYSDKIPDEFSKEFCQKLWKRGFFDFVSNCFLYESEDILKKLYNTKGWLTEEYVKYIIKNIPSHIKYVPKELVTVEILTWTADHERSKTSCFLPEQISIKQLGIDYLHIYSDYLPPSVIDWKTYHPEFIIGLAEISFETFFACHTFIDFDRELIKKHISNSYHTNMLRQFRDEYYDDPEFVKILVTHDPKQIIFVPKHLKFNPEIISLVIKNCQEDYLEDESLYLKYVDVLVENKHLKRLENCKRLRCVIEADKILKDKLITNNPTLALYFFPKLRSDKSVYLKSKTLNTHSLISEIKDDREWQKRCLQENGKIIYDMIKYDPDIIFDVELVSIAFKTYRKIYYMVYEKMRKHLQQLYDL